MTLVLFVGGPHHGTELDVAPLALPVLVASKHPEPQPPQLPPVHLDVASGLQWHRYPVRFAGPPDPLTGQQELWERPVYISEELMATTGGNGQRLQPPITAAIIQWWCMRGTKADSPPPTVPATNGHRTFYRDGGDRAVIYLATCECSTEPLRFEYQASRDQWAKAHHERTGHTIEYSEQPSRKEDTT